MPSLPTTNAPRFNDFRQQAERSNNQSAQTLVNNYQKFYTNTFQQHVGDLQRVSSARQRDPKVDTAQAEAMVAADLATLNNMQREVASAVGNQELQGQLSENSSLILTDQGTTTSREVMAEVGISSGRQFDYSGRNASGGNSDDGSQSVTVSTLDNNKRTVSATSSFTGAAATSDANSLTQSSSAAATNATGNWSATVGGQAMTGGIPLPLGDDKAKRDNFLRCMASGQALGKATANEKANAFCYYMTLPKAEQAELLKTPFLPNLSANFDALKAVVTKAIPESPSKTQWGYENYNNIFNAIRDNGTRVS